MVIEDIVNVARCGQGIIIEENQIWRLETIFRYKKKQD